MSKRTHFTREFKLEAVRLLETGDKPGTVLARELGIRRNQLYKWKEQIDIRGKSAFPGKGRPANIDTQTEKILHLEQALAKSREEVEILKKAAAFFAKEMK